MENEAEINIIDVRNINIDIATVSKDEILKFYKNSNSILDAGLLFICDKYKSILLNIYKKSAIESINIRNLLVFNIIPTTSNSKNSIVVRCINTKPVFNTKISIIPPDIDIHVSGFLIHNLELLNVINYYYNFSERSSCLTEIMNNMNKFKFIHQKQQYKLSDIELLREMLIKVCDFYLSNVFTYLQYEPTTLTENTNEITISTYTELRSEYYEKYEFMVKKLSNAAYNNERDLINIIYNTNSMHILLDVLLGVEIDEFIQNREIERLKLQVDYDIKLKNMEIKNKFMRYLIIVEEKLGYEKYIKCKNANNINILTKHEQEIVTIEYENITNEWKGMINNNCGHLQIVRKLYRGANVLHELNQYIDFTTKTTRYICKNCSYPIICPHLYDKFLGAIEKWPFDKIKSNIQKYISDVSYSRYVYYCKICSEDLMIIDNNVVETISIDDEKRVLVWVSVMRALENFDFKVVQSPKLIARNATNIVISAVNQQPIIDDLLYVIYGYAFVLDYYIESKNLILVNSTKILKISEVANKLIKSLTEKYYVLIRDSYTSIDNISEKFLLAYKSMKGFNVNIEYDPIKDIIRQILANPIYQYCYLMANLDGKLGNKSEKTQLEYVIGSKLDEYIKNQRKIRKNPEIIKLFQSGSANDYTLKELKILPEQHFYETKFTNITERNKIFNIIYGEQIYDKLYENFYKSFELFINYLKYVDNDEKLEKFTQELKECNNTYATCHNSMNFYPLNAHLDMKSTLYENRELYLSYNYDENGKKHKWTKYIYEAGEFTVSDLMKKSQSTPLLDMKCGICGTLRSKIFTLNENKINSALTLKFDIMDFYTEFQSLCPAQNNKLHKYVNNICEYCKLSDKMTLESDELQSYYDEYKDKLLLKEKININIPESIDIEIPNIEWKYDYSNIIKVCEIANLQPLQILILGFTNNILYKSSLNDTYISSCYDTMEINDSRLYTVLSYIQLVIMQYTQLCHSIGEYEFVIQYMESHKNIDFSKLPKIDIPTFNLSNSEPIELIKNLQDCLCRVVLKMGNFGILAIQNIIKLSMLISKNEQFNFSILYHDELLETYEESDEENNDEDEIESIEDENEINKEDE